MCGVRLCRAVFTPKAGRAYLYLGGSGRAAAHFIKWVASRHFFLSADAGKQQPPTLFVSQCVVNMLAFVSNHSPPSSCVLRFEERSTDQLVRNSRKTCCAAHKYETLVCYYCSYAGGLCVVPFLPMTFSLRKEIKVPNTDGSRQKLPTSSLFLTPRM